MAALREKLLNQVIGNYRIYAQLGEGGMGAVFAARHESIGRRAAIKVLRPEVAAYPEVLARFINEAKAANRILHPGVVQIYEYGQLPEGPPYLIMEYLEGETLAVRLHRIAKLPPGRLGLDGLWVLRQIAAVLVLAHRQGVAHRDLKPSNVMLVVDPDVPGGERVKVLDFGIAKIIQHALPPDLMESFAEVKTHTGAILGTPHYMAPEQWHSAKHADSKIDVYALGVIAYQILVGRLPFDARGMGELASMHMFDSPTPLERIDPKLPRELTRLVGSMLEKEAPQRPGMDEVASTLARLVGSAQEPPADFSALPHAETLSLSAVLPGGDSSGAGRLLSGDSPADAGLLATPLQASPSPSPSPSPSIVRRRVILGLLVLLAVTAAGTAGWRLLPSRGGSGRRATTLSGQPDASGPKDASASPADFTTRPLDAAPPDLTPLPELNSATPHVNRNASQGKRRKEKGYVPDFVETAK